MYFIENFDMFDTQPSFGSSTNLEVLEFDNEEDTVHGRYNIMLYFFCCNELPVPRIVF
jgi:hypothetical protein